MQTQRLTRVARFLEQTHHGLIVSCQAFEGDPTFGPAFMAAFARSAAQGGAVGIRANGTADIAAIRAAVSLPIIGIQKERASDGRTLITASAASAMALADAGADVIALDATPRPRPGGLTAEELIHQIQELTGLPVLADVETLAQGSAAVQSGADLVASTLAVYHCAPYTPDLELLAALAHTVAAPVIAEGNYWEPAQVAAALAAGAHAVVVGSAITRPWLATERFVQATRS
jgi:N-acylglucosamine-6-phosphate 2-epimerase